MRPVAGILILTALLLQACATTGGSEATEQAQTAPAERAYVPTPGLSDKERFREALNLLEEGEPKQARAELVLYLDAQPRSKIGRDLLEQIDTPADEYFPADYREIKLQSGWSLSNVSQTYLGSVFKFHALAKYNGIAEPRKLSAGQTLRVPLTDEARAAFAVADSDVAEPLEETPTLEPEAMPEEMDVAEEADMLEQPPATAEPEVVQPPSESEAQPSTEAQPEAEPDVEAQPEPAAQEAPDPYRAEALHREALNAYRAQDLDRAIELWDQVLEIDPGHENARLYRSQAVELKKKLSNLL